MGDAALQPPALDGVFTAADAALAEAADDFGHLVHRRPLGVVRPGSVEDVVRVVRFARERDLKVAPRGAGHTSYGQAQVEAGIVVDLRPLSATRVVGADRAEVGAGALWGSVLRETLAHGLMPPVLPDFLSLSVGGTLSVGGIGGTSFRHGAQVDNVVELQVVTGEGRLVTCSPMQEPPLFEMALGGLGQCGIIVGATLRLIAAAPTSRVFLLWYADLPDLTRDLRWLVSEERFSSLVGYILPSPSGGWAFMLEAIAHLPVSWRAGSGAAPDDAALLAGLGHLAGSEQVRDYPFLAYADRMAAQVAALQAAGLWQHPHPWLDLFVPASRADAFVQDTLARLAPADVGPLPLLLCPLRPARLTRPLLRVPDEEMIFLFDILRTAPPDPAAAAAQVAANRELFERNRALGGTHYLPSAIPLSREDWRQHFGPAWETLTEARVRFDPDGLLTPGPGIW